jgi:hypothetical protein
MSDIHSHVAASGFGLRDRDSLGNISPNLHKYFNQITNALNILHPDAGVRNLRVLHHRGRMVSLFFEGTEELAKEVLKRDDDRNVKAIFIQLQEIDAAAVANVSHGEGVSRSHIKKYNWLALDVDTIRPDKAKSNATDEEKLRSWAVAVAIYKYLRSQGWPAAIVADSGNGWHILFRVDLPYDQTLGRSDPNYLMLVNCLKALAAKFNNAHGEVDITLAEPEQLIKLWGTMVRKSPEFTDERPWRRSCLKKIPEKVEVVSRELLEKLAADAPAPIVTIAKSGGYPKTVEDFDLQHYMDFNNLEQEGDEFERNGVHYVPLSECVMGERKHRGSNEVSCLTYTDDGGFGYSCMNESECGEYTIKDILRKLAKENGRYPYPIFETQELDDVEFDGDAVDETAPSGSEPLSTDEILRILGGVLIDSPLPFSSGDTCAGEPTPTLEAEGPKDVSVECTSVPEPQGNPEWSDYDWSQKLACVIFRDPRSCFSDYAIWRQRLLKIVEKKAWPTAKMPLLKAITEFELSSRRLPTKSEFLEKYRNDQTAVELVQHLEPVADITLDYVAENLVRTAAYLDEKRTAKNYSETLEKSKDIAKARALAKSRWQDSITMVERRFHEGSLQDNADAVYERYWKMTEGQTPEEIAKSLRFLSGFPTIDEAINSDMERCFALIGPPNNFKTSILLSVVNNLGRQGKAVLLVTGEHDPGVLEEYMALLEGYHLRDQLPVSLPAHKAWRDGKATKEHLEALRLVIEDMKALRSCPAPIVIKHINDFHNDLDEIVQYMENTHNKYEWKAVVIDPFDTLLLNTEANQRFFKGGELIQKLFDLKTSYHGGDGLIVMTSLQMKKSVKGEVEKLQHKPESNLSDFDRVLDASQIETHSAAVQKFDMLWGVASRNDSMTQGVLVCSRVRFGTPFEPFWFHVDRESHYCYERRRTAPVAQIDGFKPGEID